MRTLSAAAALAAATAVLAALPLAGCAASAPVAGPSATESAEAEETPTISPGEDVAPTTVPTLLPGGTAEQNRRYWDAKLAEYVAGVGLGSSAIMRQHLAGAGFDPAAVEVTYEVTAAGFAADSLEVAVRVGDECLLGTIHPDRWASDIGHVLGTGRCLIGATAP